MTDHTPTPDTARLTPEARMKAAAASLRRAANAAICDCGGPVCNLRLGWMHQGEASARMDAEGAAQWVVLASPLLGDALADWLDRTAEWSEQGDEQFAKWIGEPMEIVNIIEMSPLRSMPASADQDRAGALEMARMDEVAAARESTPAPTEERDCTCEDDETCGVCQWDAMALRDDQDEQEAARTAPTATQAEALRTMARLIRDSANNCVAADEWHEGMRSAATLCESQAHRIEADA